MGVIMKHELFGIAWAGLDMLILFPFIVALSLLVIWRYYRQKKYVLKLAAPQHLPRLLRNFSLTQKLIKTFLIIISVLLLQAALLGPQWGKKEEIVLQEGRDLMIALDVSRSMLAQDCLPNRLSYAKKKIIELLHTLAADRVGLIIFSGEACVQCPLTSDHDAFAMFLEELDVETISSGRTALEAPIIKALDIFSQMPTKKSKLVALFTDGEDFSFSLENLKNRIQDLNLQISTIGIGTTQGAPIPLFDASGKTSGHQRDEQGAIVISRLNEATLQSLVSASGGVYIRTTADAQDIKQLTNWVEKYEKEQRDNKSIEHLEEKYYYCAGIALFLLCLEWLL